MIKHNPRNGFTLVELLIALVIIGVLAGSLLLTMASSHARSEATKIVSDLRTIKAAAILYYMDKGELPATRGSGGWSLWSVTALQNYLQMDLSGYALSGTNSDGVTASSFDANVKKGYSLYLMEAGTGSYASEIGKLLFVAAWVGGKPISVKRALENMADTVQLYNGNYTEYIGQQQTGALPYYTANQTSDLNGNIVLMRVF